MYKKLIVKTIVIKATDDYVIQLEVANGHVFLHLQVFNWNKSILKALRMDFNLGLEDLKEQGVDLLFFYGTEKQIKLAKKMGKEFYSVTPLQDKYAGYFVVSWET